MSEWIIENAWDIISIAVSASVGLLVFSFENQVWTGNTGVYIPTDTIIYWYRYSIDMNTSSNTQMDGGLNALAGDSSSKSQKIKIPSVTIESIVGQKLTREMKKMIREAFREEFQRWKEGQKDIDGHYLLSVCEKIELGTEDDYVSIPIEFEDEIDGGYLHVYGLKEVEN